MIALLPGGAAVADQIELTLTKAQIGISPDGGPAVDVQFDAPSARRLGSFTSKLIDQKIYFYLGDQLLFAPVVRQPLYTNTGQFSGGGELEGAIAYGLAERLLRAGRVTVSDAAFPSRSESRAQRRESP